MTLTSDLIISPILFNSKFGVWVHLEAVECHILFIVTLNSGVSLRKIVSRAYLIIWGMIPKFGV